jgi:hypothetical protein
MCGRAIEENDMCRTGLLWLVISALFELFSNYAQARSVCDSACIDATGVSVKVVTLREGQHDYPVPAAKNEDEQSDCEDRFGDPDLCRAGGVSTCEEDVRYVEIARVPQPESISVGDGRLEKVNERVRRIASTRACSIESASVAFIPERVYVRGDLVSMVFYDLDLLPTDGGGCHGEFQLLTFDLQKGDRELSLGDIVPPGQWPALESALLSEFRQASKSLFDNRKPENQPKLLDSASKKAKQVLDRQGLQAGIFIEDGKVQVNIPMYISGCTGGNFNPVHIPNNFLRTDFLTKLTSVSAGQ